jgi:hypothetical protein
MFDKALERFVWESTLILDRFHVDLTMLVQQAQAEQNFGGPCVRIEEELSRLKAHRKTFANRYEIYKKSAKDHSWL